MSKFRKKPVVIEAFQMTQSRRWDNVDWPEWLGAAWQEERGHVGALQIQHGLQLLEVVTLEGVMRISWDDWIIQGVKGELYPCKPDIFEQTYEEELA